MPTEPAARCAGLVKIYLSATGETQALRGVDATFTGRAVTVVTGPSGSGKSSLLAVMALRERQSGGRLWVAGRETAELSRGAVRELRRCHVAWVPQRPAHALFPHLTVAENLEQAARMRGASSVDTGRLLERLGLADRRGAGVRQLSGGEQQRLAVAGAVVGSPALVIADEPTAELDDASSELVLTELARCAAAGSAVVLSSHDHRVAAAADRVLHLRHGVLSTEQRGAGAATATIDSTGRLQLPPEALGSFPDGQALVVVEERAVRLLPPGDETDEAGQAGHD